MKHKSTFRKKCELIISFIYLKCVIVITFYIFTFMLLI